MRKHIIIHFNLKISKLTKAGEAPIYVRIVIEGKRKIFQQVIQLHRIGGMEIAIK